MRLEGRYLPIIRISVAILIATAVILSILKWEGRDKDLPDITVASSRVDDTTFKVDGNDIDFMDRIATKSAGIKIEARFFGDPVEGDMNGDGVSDSAIWFSYSTSSDEVFYYVAVAVGTEDGYVGTNAILLGDRIAPQMLEVRDGIIVANYADRMGEEPTTTAPSLGVSKYFKIDDGILIETTPPLNIVSPCEGCSSIGGKFDAKNMECLNVSPGQCVSIGGTFNECASACRNNPKATMCTLQCVGVCQFTKARVK